MATASALLQTGPKYPQALNYRGVTLAPTPHFEAIDQSQRAIDEARASQLVVDIVNGTAYCRNREQRGCDDEHGHPGGSVSDALHASTGRAKYTRGTQNRA